MRFLRIWLIVRDPAGTRTSPFRKDAQYSRFTTVPLRRPSADTAMIVSAALAGLRANYRSGFKLTKAGVMLLDLQPDKVQQGELALEEDEVQDRGRLMSTLDGLNLRYGRGTVLMASAGLVHEAGAQDAGVHNLLGGYADGAGVTGLFTQASRGLGSFHCVVPTQLQVVSIVNNLTTSGGPKTPKTINATEPRLISKFFNMHYVELNR